MISSTCDKGITSFTEKYFCNTCTKKSILFLCLSLKKTKKALAIGEKLLYNERKLNFFSPLKRFDLKSN